MQYLFPLIIDSKMIKPDFKKFCENHPEQYILLKEELANQFAKEYAKQVSIEFLKWDEENFGWTGIKETKEQKYNRFKDES